MATKARPSANNSPAPTAPAADEPELPLGTAPTPAPVFPNIDAVVEILRESDLGGANRRIAADFPASTLEQRIILLRQATKVIWESWLADPERKKREALARRCHAARTVEPG
jgi:hypothetical protein